MSKDPRILLFTGDGKGKTTAALGMALRAVGHQMPTLILEFIKADSSTGELAAARALPGLEIRQVGLGFVPPATSPKFEEHREAARRGLQTACEALASHRYQVVILDEICSAAAMGLVPEASVIAAVKLASPDSVVVLTGRQASPALIDLADTVSEMRCVKHGYQRGLKAQMGVEF